MNYRKHLQTFKTAHRFSLLPVFEFKMVKFGQKSFGKIFLQNPVNFQKLFLNLNFFKKSSKFKKSFKNLQKP
jgi:hypothetical protein